MFQISLELAALICATIVFSRMVSRWTPLFGFHIECVYDFPNQSHGYVMRYTVYLFCIAVLRWDKMIQLEPEVEPESQAAPRNHENNA